MDLRRAFHDRESSQIGRRETQENTRHCDHSIGAVGADVVADDGVRSGVVVVCQESSVSLAQNRSGGPLAIRGTSRPMSPVLSASSFTCLFTMNLRTCFVHSHRTPVEHRPLQRSNRSLGFSCLAHLDKSHTAGLAGIPVHHDSDGFDASMCCKNFSQLLLCYRDIQVTDENIGHEFIPDTDLPEGSRESGGIFKGDLERSPFPVDGVLLDRHYVLSLPPFGALRHVELHGLALLQALEAASLDCRKMHKNIVARLAADKAVALGIVKPLYCSLLNIVVLLFLFDIYAGWSRR